MTAIGATRWERVSAGRLGAEMFRLHPAPGIERHGFICGCGHSGTTLIANILGTHPQIHVPLRETNLFLVPPILRPMIYRRTTREVLGAGKPMLVEKTPRHIRKLEQIRAAFPGARIVIPVRDGRDVAASLYKRTGRMGYSTRRWIDANRIVADQIGRDDVFIYRHEDLVRHSEEVLRRMCAFLGVDYTPDLLEYHKVERNWHGLSRTKKTEKRWGLHHNRRRNWQVNQPFFDSSGSWRKLLNEDDLVAIIEGEGRPLMELFGYLGPDSAEAGIWNADTVAAQGGHARGA